jgi:hypothetical protein
MQVIDRSLQPSQYWPGLYALFGMDYERLSPSTAVLRHQAVGKGVRRIHDRTRRPWARRTAARTGAGAVRRAERRLPYAGHHASYGLAVAISREAKDDNLYEDVGSRMMKELAFSARQTEEYIAHAPLQVATDAVNGLRADGVPLISPATRPPAACSPTSLFRRTCPNWRSKTP